MTGPGATESENLTGITFLPVDLKLLVPSTLMGCWTEVAKLVVCGGNKVQVPAVCAETILLFKTTAPTNNMDHTASEKTFLTIRNISLSKSGAGHFAGPENALDHTCFISSSREHLNAGSN